MTSSKARLSVWHIDYKQGMPHDFWVWIHDAQVQVKNFKTGEKFVMTFYYVKKKLNRILGCLVSCFTSLMLYLGFTMNLRYLWSDLTFLFANLHDQKHDTLNYSLHWTVVAFQIMYIVTILVKSFSYFWLCQSVQNWPFEFFVADTVQFLISGLFLSI